MLPQELIRLKRDGARLSRAHIDEFVRGLCDGRWSDSQAAALAMAIVWRGMDLEETADLTRAMTHSGQVLDWQALGEGMHAPVLDKHSTGGVGDKVSLILAPALAACGALVPMVSGRGLGHTGGTLDKLEALPGYTCEVDAAQLRGVLQRCGCAIVGANESLAPADRRLYALRDVTATVESVPLITASILSKKLAGGVRALVMDVKVGSGAVCPDLAQAQTLSRSLVEVAALCGLPTRALITDMNEVLGRTAGNALEVRESIDFLTGRHRDARLLEVTLRLGAALLVLGGLARTEAAATAMLQGALDQGLAAERFARMVSALGGPRDVLHQADLPQAPVRVPVPAPRAGFVQCMDVRALGLTVVTLGGGRSRPGEPIDARVGLSDVVARGAHVQSGDALAWVHAGEQTSAQAAVLSVQQAITLGEQPPGASSLVLGSISREACAP